jgi:hypothetical protein
MTGFRISLLKQLTDPRVTGFSDVVFDQGAGIEVGKSHKRLAMALTNNLAQRRIEDRINRNYHQCCAKLEEQNFT